MKIQNDMRKFVFHGVHDIIDHELSEHEWDPNEEIINKIVFIGKNLDREALRKGIEKHSFEKYLFSNPFVKKLPNLDTQHEKRVV